MSDTHPSDEERAARLAAQRKAWNDAHPGYYAEYRERNREDIRRKNRERERDRAQREREEKARRQKGIDRATAWAKEHPEERQRARERYKQKHPEAYKQAQRDYYHRNRDAIAERRRAREAADPQKANEARRRAVDRARAGGRDSAWSPTPEQRATYRERENEARRLARRRARAGLPERQLHRVHAPDRRHNDAAADEFFAKRRSGQEVARIREQDVPTPPELVHAMQERSENRRVVREILAIAEEYFAEHEVELRARVAEVSRARFRGGMLPLDVHTEPRRHALEFASRGYLRASVASPTSSITVFRWLTTDLAKRGPEISL
ncbi:hypothetical protein FVP74_04785 [Microbacterium saccharophilum]|uniref:Uncharacterized protein n=1 Tax=Microbacterium saccharophilum TaxID=1213358 RepID=A0A5C8I6S5_9MICO|nr:hypothetical protein [Microbacterium saccharophilum]TXK13920.1 hypothetical protein FVP74_04785 [Microbacterium saccharophilum]GEP48940.1 hypothetical protein MSA03_24480 [Microbacterium saccharophilum]